MQQVSCNRGLARMEGKSSSNVILESPVEECIACVLLQLSSSSVAVEPRISWPCELRVADAPRIFLVQFNYKGRAAMKSMGLLAFIGLLWLLTPRKQTVVPISLGFQSPAVLKGRFLPASR